MDVYLLGPIEARLDGRPIELGARKLRAVLAMLALQVDRTVSADRLAEGLWGEDLPPSAAKMVQSYVSRLRRLLDGDAAEIVTRGRGYELRLAGGTVDAVRFERLIEAARAREALAVWRSEPLSDVADEPFAAAEIRRLVDLRLRASELAIDADLAAGRDIEVLGELEALLEEAPLRERLHAQRMLALYRSGRQGDALNAYREARAALVERIGVEPGPELLRLHAAILRQDPALEPQAPAELPPELDTSTPLAGRERELDWLRRHWSRARGGAGAASASSGSSARTASACTPSGPVAIATMSAVRTLARHYAGAQVEVPVDRLLARSAGFPERLHAAASEWAQGLAARRVEDAAKRTAAERPRLRAAEDGLVGSVIQLQAARERAGSGVNDNLVVCPFKGLAFFDTLSRDRWEEHRGSRAAGSLLAG